MSLITTSAIRRAFIRKFLLPKPSPEGDESELHFEEWPAKPRHEYDYKFAAICLICSEQDLMVGLDMKTIINNINGKLQNI